MIILFHSPLLCHTTSSKSLRPPIAESNLSISIGKYDSPQEQRSQCSKSPTRVHVYIGSYHITNISMAPIKPPFFQLERSNNADVMAAMHGNGFAITTTLCLLGNAR